MKLQLKNEAGAGAGEIEVSDAVFGAAFNEPLVHQIVVAYQAGGRIGSRKQKTRSEVRGGGRKPYAQKGTGQARAGTIRSPLWRGGGKVFPNTPDENFKHKVNRKMYQGAIRAILSELVRQDRLVAVKEFKVETPKTKALIAKLNGFSVNNALIVTDSIDSNLELAARNLAGIEVTNVSGADPVSLVRFDKVILTQAAAKRFEEWLA
jgi:large subunit ribosomal protein L4